jgi:ribonuclease P protein subunit POP4
MRAVPENLLRHELIGLQLKIVQAKNRYILGMGGTVIDESKNMLTLSTGKRNISIPKTVAIFRIKLANGCLVDVDGARLVGRPEGRLKTRIRRW